MKFFSSLFLALLPVFASGYEVAYPSGGEEEEERTYTLEEVINTAPQVLRGIPTLEPAVFPRHQRKLVDDPANGPGSLDDDATRRPTIEPAGGPGGADGTQCFSGHPVVEVREKGPVKIEDLEIGDQILVGENKFQPIFAFGHLNKEREAEFLQIGVDAPKGAPSSLEISEEHLLFLESSRAVRADSLKVGDVLQGNDAPLTVRSIKKVRRSGLYAPGVEDGVFVANGIKVSAYVGLQPDNKEAFEFVQFKNGFSTGFSQHTGAHMAGAPLRFVCLGLGLPFCQQHDEEGMLLYTSYGLKLCKWIEGSSIWVQMLAYFPVLACVVPFVALEMVFGASFAPLGLLAVLSSLLVFRVFSARLKVKKVKSL